MLNKQYKLYARFASGYTIKFKYVPTRYCDNVHIYCFLRGKYAQTVRVSDLILQYGDPEVQNA